MSNYSVGTLITITATFRDATSALIDPTTVAAILKLPTQELQSLSVTRASLGVYTTQILPELVGGYAYEFAGSGNCQVSAFGQFNSTGLF